MTGALRAWLAAAAAGADDRTAGRAALAELADDPWQAMAFAELLVRSDRVIADSALGLTTRLQVRDVRAPGLAALVPPGRPYPQLRRGEPPALDRQAALRFVDAARSIAETPPTSLLDLDMGVGATLLAAESWGLTRLTGVTRSPLAAELANGLLPRANVVPDARGGHDLLLLREEGLDRLDSVEPGTAAAAWLSELRLQDPAWRRDFGRRHRVRAVSLAPEVASGPARFIAFLVAAGPTGTGIGGWDFSPQPSELKELAPPPRSGAAAESRGGPRQRIRAEKASKEGQ